MSLNWVEIADEPNRLRYDCLSEALQSAGVENTVAYVATDVEGFPGAFSAAIQTYQQIRLGSLFYEQVLGLTTQMPAQMLTLKSADSFVQNQTEAGRQWWPRCFLAKGLARALVTDVKSIDLTAAAFVLGAGGETRAVVAALAQLGFKRFSLSDSDENRARALVTDLRRCHFGAQFHFVSRQSITSLPSVHSVAVNTMAIGHDDGMLAELFYFNFLKGSGIWIDLRPGPKNQDLEAEAKAVGAVVLPAHRVLMWTDVEWASESLAVKLDLESLAQAYAQALIPKP